MLTDPIMQTTPPNAPPAFQCPPTTKMASGSRPTYTVREINSIDALAPWREDWTRLLDETPNATFFHTFEWLETYWRWYGAEQRLRVMLVFNGERLLGILPLDVRTESTRVGKMRVLGYPLDGWGAFYGPLGPDPLTTLQESLRFVSRTTRDWDLLDLRWVGEHCDANQQFQRAIRKSGCSVISQPWADIGKIDLTLGWEEYWNSRTSKWRNNTRRCEKKLAKRGELRFVRVRAGSDGAALEPTWDLYDICEQVAELSWQGKSTTGTTLTHASVRGFLRDAHAAAAGVGASDICLLYVGERAVAFAYNYVFKGVVFGLRIGFDEAFAKEGAGTVLNYYLIRDSAQRGDTRMVLGEGYLACKRGWLTRVAHSRHFVHFPLLSPRAQALRVKCWVQQQFPGLAGGKHA